MMGLRVSRVRAGLMLGPERELASMASRARAGERAEFERMLTSFVAAEVLFDKNGIWLAVLRSLRDVAQQLGIATASPRTSA